MIIKVDTEAKNVLMEMLDVVVKTQGLKVAKFALQFENLVQVTEDPKSDELENKTPLKTEMSVVKSDTTDSK